MIIHHVVVTKPKVMTPAQIPRIAHSPLAWQVTNQQEYNEFLNELTFSKGDYITMVPNEVTTPMQIHMVCDIQTDYHKVEFNRMFEPKPYLVTSSFYSDGPGGLGPWTRWDMENHYRRITQGEYLKFIGSAHDSISSNCHANAEQYKRHKAQGSNP